MCLRFEMKRDAGFHELTSHAVENLTHLCVCVYSAVRKHSVCGRWTNIYLSVCVDWQFWLKESEYSHAIDKFLHWMNASNYQQTLVSHSLKSFFPLQYGMFTN